MAHGLNVIDDKKFAILYDLNKPWNPEIQCGGRFEL